MKKKFISIAKKAMVWTMAASMLVATPLTASASGLSDIYKTEDQWGNNIGTDGKVHNETKKDENGNDVLVNYTGDPSRTGTVTSTNTNTSILDNANSFDGIMIKPQDIERNQDAVGTEETVEVVLTKGNADGTISEIAVPEEMQGRFTWKSSNTSVATFASAVDRKTNTMKLQIKGGGRATITASLDDYKNDLHYSDTISVLIKQKATKIGFSKELQEDAFAGDSLVLDEYVELYPEGSTDEVTYALISNSNPRAKATLKNGVLKLNAKSKAGDTVEIIAIGDEVRSDVTRIEINRTIPATDATFTVSTTKGTSPEIKKNKTYNWLINNDGMSGTAVIKMTGKDNGSVVDSTDRIVSWTSKKPDIVAVETIARNSDNKKGLKVTLVPKAVGTAQIVAKTGRGKTFSFKVTVKADLKGVELPDNMQAYSGQMVQLTATQKFTEHGKENFTDAGLKWEIIGSNNAEDKNAVKAAKKVASINKSTGLLTVKADIKDVTSIKIKASGAKKDSNKQSTSDKNDTMTVNLQQVDIKKIVVYPNAYGYEDSGVTAGSIAAVSNPTGSKIQTDVKFNAKNTPINVAVGDKKTFALYAEADIKEGNAADCLGWTVNNAKLAKAVKNPTSGSIEGVKRGSATITVSGSAKVKNKWKVVKITMKASVTQPSKTIQLTSKKAVLYGKNVSFKATLEKGSSTKAKDLEWTATNLSSGKNEKTVFKNGKWKVNYPVGTEVLIRARVKETGISASMRLYVVNKTSKLTINDKDGNAIPRNKYALDATKITLTENPYTLQPMVNSTKLDVTKHEMARVTYTMNKQDYVRIVENADGTITLKPIQNGTVKITPVSTDGKKGTALTVTVSGVTLNEKAEGAPYSIQ